MPGLYTRGRVTVAAAVVLAAGAGGTAVAVKHAFLPSARVGHGSTSRFDIDAIAGVSRMTVSRW